MIEFDLQTLAPLSVDAGLLVGAMALLITDLILPPGDKKVLGWSALAILAAALLGTTALDITGASVGEAYVADGLTVLLKQLFYAAGILTILGSLEYAQREFPRRQGEYYLLLLFSILGMSLLAGARDLILLAVCFELMGIPLYVLASFSRKDGLAVEAALKLFLVGAVSTVTMMYGLSLLFAFVGSTNLAVIGEFASADANATVALGLAMTLAGMGFKIGVVPFHMWVPDTYQGASTPFVAFLSTAPKAAGVVAMMQVLGAGNNALGTMANGLLIAMVVATLIVGNLLAVNQNNVKRLLGYSGIAHMGFILMAMAVGAPMGTSMLAFYLVAYLFTNFGAFLVLLAVNPTDREMDIDLFDGLYLRSRVLAWAMLAFLLSLAGIPFVLGFWAKMYVFMAAWKAGMTTLVLLGAVMSVLALFYYLRLVRAMFMNAPPTGAPPIQFDAPTGVAIAICLAVVVFAGAYPPGLLNQTDMAAQSWWASHHLEFDSSQAERANADGMGPPIGGPIIE